MIGSNKIKSLFEAYFIAVLLVVFFLSEGFAKIYELSVGDRTWVPRSIKLAVLAFFLFSVFFFEVKKIIKLFAIPLIFFGFGQLFLVNSFTLNAIVTFGKYLFPIFLFTYFSIHTSNENYTKKTLQVFKGVLVINSLLAILGFIFTIRFFETYDGSRFGYNGLLLTSATSTYVYFLGISFYLIQGKEILKKWDFWVVMLAALLVGTKSLYFSLCLLSFLLLFLKVRKPLRYIIVFLGTILFASIYYVLFYQVDLFIEIRETRGILGAVLSYRNELFLEDTLPDIKQNWSFVNYLFGGVSDIELRSEMSFIDIFYFFGSIGGVYYLYTYFKTYFSEKNILKTYWPYFIILAIIVAIAGNFFFYATIPIYLLLFKEALLTKLARLSS